MPVPSTMSDLSTTAASNSPAGTEAPNNADDHLRAGYAILRTTNAKGSDIASAATTDIGAATGEFVDVTGTTTITSLGTISAGIVRTVRFTGALTLTHNATSLILPSGANITTANGDVAMFRSLGSGNWLCAGYVRANGQLIASAVNFSTPVTIASAATVNIGAAASNVVIISGTTTITAFDTVAAGTMRWVRFSGALTLTYNATSLIIPGSANITTAANDEMVAVSLGSGNWKIISYTKADGTILISNSSVPERQTVLSGPVDTNGLPSFGGSAGSTTVTASGTLIVTAANGAAITGAVDRVGSISDPSWTGLSTNGTMYLYLDVAANGTCTTGSGTLSPTYRWGGADVTTNGQFTFNIQEMSGKVGNGSTATQAYRVYVGQVTVSGGVVSTITWYALMGRYSNKDTGVPSTTRLSKSHNLGIVPSIIEIHLQCQTSDIGYAAGDELNATSVNSSGVSPAVSSDTLTVGIITASATINTLNKTTGTNTALTTGNWDTVFNIRRGW